MVASTTHYYRTLKNHPHRVRFVASRLLRLSRFARLVTMRFPRFRLRLYPTSLSESYWIDPAARANDHAFLERYLRAGDTVIDVGANIGALTVHSAAIVGPSGRVLAFEGHPRTFRFLCGNISLNGADNVTPYGIALGSSTGRITFSDLRDDDQNAVVADGALSVALSPLDAFTHTLQRIDLLKVDVEGYELEVFNGARETLAKTACVYYESYERHFASHGHRAADVITLLEASGFSVFSIHQGGLTRAASDHRSETCENLIAVRDPAAFGARYARADGVRRQGPAGAPTGR